MARPVEERPWASLVVVLFCMCLLGRLPSAIAEGNGTRNATVSNSFGQGFVGSAIAEATDYMLGGVTPLVPPSDSRDDDFMGSSEDVQVISPDHEASHAPAVTNTTSAHALASYVNETGVNTGPEMELSEARTRGLGMLAEKLRSQRTIADTPLGDWRFKRSLGSLNHGPSLQSSHDGNGNHFITDDVDARSVTCYRFKQNKGLRVHYTDVGDLKAHTLVMLVRLDSVSGYKKLVDYKQLKADHGLYVKDGKLVFYNDRHASSATVQAGTYVQVTLVRHASSREVQVYSGGDQQFHFEDNHEKAVPADGHFAFFVDDRNGREASSGAVARIRLYNRALSSDEIRGLERLKGPGGELHGLVADYTFENSLGSQVVGNPAPALVALGASGRSSGNRFTTAAIDGHSGVTVYRFEKGKGLSVHIGHLSALREYTIVILLALDEISGYRKIIDFSHLKSDRGLYVRDGKLWFYNFTHGSKAVVHARRWHQIVLTRTESNLVTGYVDGQKQFSFTDSSKAAIPHKGLLDFFEDDQHSSRRREESPGEVARMRIYPHAKTSTAVARLSRLEGDRPHVARSHHRLTAARDEHGNSRDDRLSQAHASRYRIRLMNGYEPYSSLYAAPVYHVGNGICRVDGVAHMRHGGAVSDDGTLFRLPPQCRPSGSVTIPATTGNNEVQLWVQHDGNVVLKHSFGSTSSLVGLNSIIMAQPKSSGQGVDLASGWRPFQHHGWTGGIRAVAHGGKWCTLEGMVSATAAGRASGARLVGRLPIGCRPPSPRLSFVVTRGRVSTAAAGSSGVRLQIGMTGCASQSASTCVNGAWCCKSTNTWYGENGGQRSYCTAEGVCLQTCEENSDHRDRRGFCLRRPAANQVVHIGQRGCHEGGRRCVDGAWCCTNTRGWFGPARHHCSRDGICLQTCTHNNDHRNNKGMCTRGARRPSVSAQATPTITALNYGQGGCQLANKACLSGTWCCTNGQYGTSSRQCNADGICLQTCASNSDQRNDYGLCLSRPQGVSSSNIVNIGGTGCSARGHSCIAGAWCCTDGHYFFGGDRRTGQRCTPEGRCLQACADRNDVRLSNGLCQGAPAAPADVSPEHNARLGQTVVMTRVDILETGEITVEESMDRRNSWLSLTGITFLVAGGTRLATENNWQSFVHPGSGGEFAPPQFTVSNHFCTVSGRVQLRDSSLSANAYPLIVTLPVECRPTGKMLFGVNSGPNIVQVSVKPNGKVEWIHGTLSKHEFEGNANTNPWVSLEGISFTCSTARVHHNSNFKLNTHPWVSLNLEQGLMPYGSGYMLPSYIRDEETCYLTGLLKRNDGGASKFLEPMHSVNSLHEANFKILSAPIGCRPPHSMSFATYQGRSIARVDVYSDGRVVWQYGGDTSSRRQYLSLDGIIFPTVRGAHLPLARNYVDASSNGGQDFGRLQYFRQGNFCYISGSVRSSSTQPQVHRRRHITTLPGECRPIAGKLQFDRAIMISRPATSGGEKPSNARIDIDKDGHVYLARSGPHGHYATHRLSFDGLVFPVVRGEELSLHKDWKAYGNGYESPSYSKERGMCVVSGVVKRRSTVKTLSSGGSHVIGTLPVTCRPPGRLIFDVSSDDESVRVDVLSNGQIRWVHGGDGHTFLSLSGIYIRTAEQKHTTRSDATMKMHTVSSWSCQDLQLQLTGLFNQLAATLGIPIRVLRASFALGVPGSRGYNDLQQGSDKIRRNLGLSGDDYNSCKNDMKTVERARTAAVTVASALEIPTGDLIKQASGKGSAGRDKLVTQLRNKKASSTVMTTALYLLSHSYTSAARESRHGDGSAAYLADMTDFDDELKNVERSTDDVREDLLTVHAFMAKNHQLVKLATEKAHQFERKKDSFLEKVARRRGRNTLLRKRVMKVLASMKAFEERVRDAEKIRLGKAARYRQRATIAIEQMKHAHSHFALFKPYLRTIEETAQENIRNAKMYILALLRSLKESTKTLHKLEDQLQKLFTKAEADMKLIANQQKRQMETEVEADARFDALKEAKSMKAQIPGIMKVARNASEEYVLHMYQNTTDVIDAMKTNATTLHKFNARMVKVLRKISDRRQEFNHERTVAMDDIMHNMTVRESDYNMFLRDMEEGMRKSQYKEKALKEKADRAVETFTGIIKSNLDRAVDAIQESQKEKLHKMSSTTLDKSYGMMRRVLTNRGSIERERAALNQLTDNLHDQDEVLRHMTQENKELLKRVQLKAKKLVLAYHDMLEDATNQKEIDSKKSLLVSACKLAAHKAAMQQSKDVGTAVASKMMKDYNSKHTFADDEECKDLARYQAAHKTKFASQAKPDNSTIPAPSAAMPDATQPQPAK